MNAKDMAMMLALGGNGSGSGTSGSAVQIITLPAAIAEQFRDSAGIMGRWASSEYADAVSEKMKVMTGDFTTVLSPIWAAFAAGKIPVVEIPGAGSEDSDFLFPEASTPQGFMFKTFATVEEELEIGGSTESIWTTRIYTVVLETGKAILCCRVLKEEPQS